MLVWSSFLVIPAPDNQVSLVLKQIRQNSDSGVPFSTMRRVSGAGSIYVLLNLLHICVWNSTLRPVKGRFTFANQLLVALKWGSLGVERPLDRVLFRSSISGHRHGVCY